MQGAAHNRVRPAHAEDAESRQEVQVAGARLVKEVATLAALPPSVEADGADHPGRLRIEVTSPQGRPFAGTGFQFTEEIEAHRSRL